MATLDRPLTFRTRHGRFTVRHASLMPAVLRYVRTLDAVVERRECGANAKGGGGFQPGNTCGKGDGGVGESGTSSPSPSRVGDESGNVSVKDAQRVFRGASEKAIQPESGGNPEQIKERAEFKKKVEATILDRLRRVSSEDDITDELLKAMRFDKPEYFADAPQGESKRTALARGMVDQWAGTSGDSDPPAVAVQRAIAAELSYDVPDVKNAELGHLGQYGRLRISPERILEYRKIEKLVSQSDAVRQVIRAQYDATQDYFKEQGITEITLHRGFLAPNLVESDNAEIKLQPASSFSLNRETAVAFADGLKAAYAGVATVTVPVSRVLSTPMTGFGCLSEQEVVVIGGTVRGKLKTGGKK